MVALLKAQSLLDVPSFTRRLFNPTVGFMYICVDSSYPDFTLSITAVCFSQMFNYVTFRPFPDRCLCPSQKACNILLRFYIIEVVKCEYCISSAYGNVSLVRA